MRQQDERIRALLRRWRAGDRDAGEELVRETEGARKYILARFALTYRLQRDDVLDLESELLHELLRSAAEFDTSRTEVTFAQWYTRNCAYAASIFMRRLNARNERYLTTLNDVVQPDEDSRVRQERHELMPGGDDDEFSLAALRIDAVRALGGGDQAELLVELICRGVKFSVACTAAGIPPNTARYRLRKLAREYAASEAAEAAEVSSRDGA